MPKAKPIVCEVPFLIAVEQQELHQGSYEDFISRSPAIQRQKPLSDDTLYMLVTTKKNKFYCRVKRKAMNKLFEAIREMGVEVEF